MQRSSFDQPKLIARLMTLKAKLFAFRSELKRLLRWQRTLPRAVG
jgi:hypothetical protein